MELRDKASRLERAMQWYDSGGEIRAEFEALMRELLGMEAKDTETLKMLKELSRNGVPMPLPIPQVLNTLQREEETTVGDVMITLAKYPLATTIVGDRGPVLSLQEFHEVERDTDTLVSVSIHSWGLSEIEQAEILGRVKPSPQPTFRLIKDRAKMPESALAINLNKCIGTTMLEIENDYKYLTAVESLKELIALWSKLAEYPQKDKLGVILSSPELRHQSGYDSHCPLCEYSRGQKNPEHECQHCLIWDSELGCVRTSESPYAKWLKAPVGCQSRSAASLEMVSIAQETLDFLLSLGYRDPNDIPN